MTFSERPPNGKYRQIWEQRKKTRDVIKDEEETPMADDFVNKYGWTNWFDCIFFRFGLLNNDEILRCHKDKFLILQNLMYLLLL